MSTSREKIVSFRDDKKIVASLDAIAEKRGCDRSDIIRAMIRIQLGAYSK